MDIFNIISMFGGLALFLYGMRIMGDGLKKGSTGSFKKAIEKVTNSPILGFVIGVALTALIQSATATIVIVSGLVGAGLMTLNQSIGIILGANVGTTVTGQIIRLMDIDSTSTAWLNFFKPSTLAPVAAVIGIIFIMFLKSKNSPILGTIAMGFGILFTGLMNMTAAVGPLSESESFMNLFIKFGEHPLLGFLIGFVVAFLLQSSSASIGILQALSVSGVLTLHSIYPMLVGIYLGDCVTTAIVCTIGAKANAKRTGVVNLLFNFGKMALSAIGINIVHATGMLDAMWDASITSGGIANTHTIFNLCCALILLPLTGVFAKAACIIVKDDKPEGEMPAELAGLDEALFKSPALALNSCYKVICRMHDIIQENAPRAIALLSAYNEADVRLVEQGEDTLDMLSDNLNVYLSKITPFLGNRDQEAIQNYYIKCLVDLERAGDHIYSIAQCSGELYDKSLSFSQGALDELNMVHEMLESIIDDGEQALEKQNLESAKRIQPYVETVSLYTDNCRDNHMIRMKKGECDAVTGSIYLDIMMHISRVCDMYSNIGIHTLARHNDGLENYEHIYMAELRKGENPEFNRLMDDLREKYL